MHLTLCGAVLSLTLLHIVQGSGITLQSKNYPGYYWGLRWREPFEAFIVKLGDRFYLRSPGLTGKTGTVSFESVERPGYFLRHFGFKLYLENRRRPRNRHIFAGDATYRRREDIWYRGYVSFESVNYPKCFIRHQNYRLRISPFKKSKLFKDDASFKIGMPGPKRDPCATVRCPAGTVCVATKKRAKCVDVCTLPAEPGRCRAYFPRYFFNTKTDECERFIYGGCGGNENNFDTIEECKRQCETDPCDGFPCPDGQICIVEKSHCKTTRRLIETPKCVPSEKEGGCPLGFPFTFVNCTGVVDNCGNDYDCPGTDKCCRNICGKNECHEALDTTVKDGECPDTDVGGTICDLFDCSYDSECNGKKKCCSNRCGSNQCVERARPGTCPTPEAVSQQESKNFCFLEQDCPGVQKCCRNTEQRAVCADPAKEGGCPLGFPFRPVNCEGVVSTCETDFDCPGTDKCCRTICGKNECHVALDTTVKDGECPDTDVGGTVCDKFDCSYDSQCDGNKKCCSNKCGSTECVEPARPGTCPTPETVSDRGSHDSCVLEQNCPGAQKCCRNADQQAVCTDPDT